MYITTRRLILASASPRRRWLLHGVGISFDIVESAILELPAPTEKPSEFVARISREKCMSISSENPDAWILGADTIVALGSELLGKPADQDEAKAMLKRLSGRWHEVWTGFCVLNCNDSVIEQQTVKTEVLFSQLTDSLCDAYVSTGEPLDKAGAYAIQGIGGALVERINGSYSNVVGLPLAQVVRKLESLGIIILAL